MDIEDKELFNSAMNDEPVSEAADQPAEAPATEAPASGERTQERASASQERAGQERQRDDQGRFAKQIEPEPKPEAEASQAKDEANVPSWRLREVREEAERRVAENEARWQRQFEMLQRQSAPKPEPQPAPDLFENPQGAIEYGARQLLTPIEQRIQAIEARAQEEREFFSRRDAEKEHGPEAVRAAYNWLAQGTQARDPEVLHIYQQVMQSKHPFDSIVAAHKRTSVMQQIGNDPDAWAINRARELAAADPKHREALYSQVREATGGVRQRSETSQGSIVKLPPSMSRLPASQVDGDDDSDMSDAAMFRHAMR